MIKPSNSRSNCDLLNPNHSHFIMVDDSKHAFGGEVEFRADLEAELTKEFGIGAKKDTLCPCVVIVVGGGPNTVKFVYESVQKSNPCVFIEVFIKLLIFL